MTKPLADYQSQADSIRAMVAALNAKVAEANRAGFRVEFQTTPVFSHDGPTYQTLEIDLHLDLSVLDSE